MQCPGDRLIDLLHYIDEGEEFTSLLEYFDIDEGQSPSAEQLWEAQQAREFVFAYGLNPSDMREALRTHVPDCDNCDPLYERHLNNQVYGFHYMREFRKRNKISRPSEKLAEVYSETDKKWLGLR